MTNRLALQVNRHLDSDYLLNLEEVPTQRVAQRISVLTGRFVVFDDEEKYPD